MPDPLAALELPYRAGQKPDTTPTNPHQQLNQNAPAEIYTALIDRAFAFPGVERRPSLISVPGAQALHLAPDVSAGPREAFMIQREFAHVHPPYDGSLHLMLPLNTVKEVLAKGWGEPHPVVRLGMIPPTAVMVYAPRDADELEVVLRILATSYHFASGWAHPETE